MRTSALAHQKKDKMKKSILATLAVAGVAVVTAAAPASATTGTFKYSSSSYGASSILVQKTNGSYASVPIGGSASNVTQWYDSGCNDLVSVNGKQTTACVWHSASGTTTTVYTMASVRV
jgi:hypothetical protein